MATNEVGEVLTSQQQFEENIRAKIRTDLGSLIPDAVLKDLVIKSINEMFFKPSILRFNYGTPVYDDLSWFQKFVAQTLDSKIKGVVKDYFSQNSDRIMVEVEASLKANGPKLLAAVLIDALKGQSTSIAMNMQSDLHQRLSQIDLR